jgi:hypothetical protein
MADPTNTTTDATGSSWWSFAGGLLNKAADVAVQRDNNDTAAKIAQYNADGARAVAMPVTGVQQTPTTPAVGAQLVSQAPSFAIPTAAYWVVGLIVAALLLPRLVR